MKGSAYGFRAFNIALFNSAQPDTGPTPTVALAADASNSPQTASLPSGLVKYGPAVFFSSDAVAVSTQGTTGAGGSVTSATDIANINESTLQPAATGSEALTADRLQSTCTVTKTNPQTGATSFSGTTRITGGTLMVDTGEDLNQDDDFTDAGEHAPVVITLPTNPAPGTVHDGHIHVNGGRDNFNYIFNEQIASSDGSVTVNAVHLRLLGPTATGDVILGQHHLEHGAAGHDHLDHGAHLDDRSAHDLDHGAAHHLDHGAAHHLDDRPANDHYGPAHHVDDRPAHDHHGPAHHVDDRPAHDHHGPAHDEHDRATHHIDHGAADDDHHAGDLDDDHRHQPRHHGAAVVRHADHL